MKLKSLLTSASLVLAAGVALANPVVVRNSKEPPYPKDKPFQRRHGLGSGGAMFSLDLVRNEGYKHNGPAEYVMAFAKYGENFAEHMQTKFKLAEGPVGAYNQSYDREYLSPVYIGTPGQLCWMDLDTGSGDFWVFSSDTPSFFLDGQQIYHPEKSRTALPLDDVSWAISYGDGSYAGGEVYRDTVVLANVSISNATVETATSVSRSLTTDAVMSGIFGLALNHPSTARPRQQTLLQALAPPTMDQYVFAADLRYKAPGAYHFGYVDESAYTGNITWRDVIPGSVFWKINLHWLHIGGDNLWRLHEWPMVVDTGTTLLLLPSDLTELYWERVPGAYMSEAYYGWVFPCNATLPDFDFGFEDGWIGSVPGHYFNFQNVSKTMCYGGIQDSMEPFGILGDAFLKALYVIFDVTGSRVGLAKKTLTA